MIIGNHAVIERHLQAGFLMAGESVHVTGKIVSDNDIRADVWCKFDSDVTGGGDAYLGEFTTINGKITIEGDLDIGKEVKLNGGFLSKGWIVVRNPLPIMVFIFLYIRELMRLGRTSEEIDKTLNELFEEDEEIDLEKLDEANVSEILNRGGFLVIPIGSKITPESINVPEDTIIGSNCTIHTRIICKRFEGGKNLTFCGALRSKGEIFIDDGSRISGEINTTGKLVIGKDVKIEGNVAAKSVIIHETSFVEGKVSSGNIRFVKGSGFEVKDHSNPEKAELLSKADSFDLMNTNITEKKEAETESEEEAEAYSKTETNLEAETKTKLKAEAKTKLEAEAKTKLEAEAETKLEAEAETKLESETETKLENEAEAKLETKSKTKSGAKQKKPLAEGNISVAVADDETPAETESVSDKKAGGARSRRRTARKEKQKQLNKVEIIDVFTGENIETVKSEQDKVAEYEEPASKNEEPVSKNEKPTS